MLNDRPARLSAFHYQPSEQTLQFTTRRLLDDHIDQIIGAASSHHFRYIRNACIKDTRKESLMLMPFSFLNRVVMYDDLLKNHL